MTSGPVSVETIAFRPQRGGEHGAFGVDGQLLAQIRTRSFSRGFTATFPDGRPLCQGTPRRRRRRYLVHDAQGRLLLTMRTSLRSSRRQSVRLPDGTRFALAASRRPTHTWTVTDPSGRQVLSIEPARGRWSLHIDDVVALLADPRWNVPLVVALVFASRSEARANRITDFLG